MATSVLIASHTRPSMRPGPRPGADERSSVEPPLLLESGLELIADLLRGLVGPTVALAAAARLSVYLDPASHDQAQRVSRGYGDAKRDSGTRGPLFPPDSTLSGPSLRGP